MKGMAHITGGGLTENLPRILPIGMNAHVQRDKWEAPEIFRFLEREGLCQLMICIGLSIWVLEWF